MRLVSARFIGLKGIYSKSGIEDISIDFTKCIHNIIMIIGKNGSGKSTLLSALNPLPDSPQMYLDNKEGLKEIIYADQDIMYKITIIYPINANNTRGTTKAFLKEIINGNEVELNPNGTIGSYKDSIYSKFNLDANFMSLSRLSIEDRGLVEKKPSERKKFVGNILESVEVYNNIYKSLVKRSGIFKSMINSITAKINSIGDEQKLLMNINIINNRIKNLEEQKYILDSSISASQATISLLDSDNSIQTLNDSLIKESNNLQEIKNDIETSISLLSSKLNIKNTMKDASSKYKDLQDMKFLISKDIDIIKQKIQYTLTDREEECRLITIRNQKLQAFKLDIDMNILQKSITEYKKKIFEYENIFKNIGIKDLTITKDEYIIGLNTLNDLRNAVLNIKSYANDSHIQSACDYICNNNKEDNPINELNILENNHIKMTNLLSKYEKEYNYYKGQLDKLDILKNRPSNCNINTCIFIKDALEAQSKDPKSNMSHLQEDIDFITVKIYECEQTIEYTKILVKIYNELNLVIRSIHNNSSILNKLPNGNIFSDINSFISRVRNGDMFNDIYDLYKYIDKANILELYKNDNNILIELNHKYEIYKNKIDTINELQDEINLINEKILNIDKIIEEFNLKLVNKNKDLINIQSTIDICDKLIEKHNTIKDIISKINDTDMRIATVADSIKKISEELKKISENKGKLLSINNELTPLYDNKEKIRFSLSKLDEYKIELQEYTDKYNMIQVIKKYSSPTEGIQTIFMKLYMDRTLTMANELLSLLFDGQLELLDYEINEFEFRIPCRNTITSIINDDISSCSSAEKSMISMILSFALLYQSSTKFNIPQLDEIDAMLDQGNRSAFPTFVHTMMNILNVEMCLMISHSSEIDMSNVDIIQLTPATHENTKGNIIFQL